MAGTLSNNFGASKVDESILFGGSEQEILPLLEANEPFLLFWNQNNWHVINGSFLPFLGKLPLKAGFNGVDRDRSTGKWKLSGARAFLLERGKNIISWSKAPDGESYIYSINSKPGKDVVTTYLSVWSTAYAGQRDVTVDMDGYTDWIQSLVDDGEIPLPSIIVVDKKISQLKDAIANATRHGDDIDLNKFEEDLKIVEAFKEKHFKAVKKVPARRKKAQISIED